MLCLVFLLLHLNRDSFFVVIYIYIYIYTTHTCLSILHSFHYYHYHYHHHYYHHHCSFRVSGACNATPADPGRRSTPGRSRGPRRSSNKSNSSHSSKDDSNNSNNSKHSNCSNSSNSSNSNSNSNNSNRTSTSNNRNTNSTNKNDATVATTTTTNNNNNKIIIMIELCHLYPYPCPKKIDKLPAVLFCYTNCSTNWLGHGHGYKWHSSIITTSWHSVQPPWKSASIRSSGRGSLFHISWDQTLYCYSIV